MYALAFESISRMNIHGHIKIVYFIYESIFGRRASSLFMLNAADLEILQTNAVIKYVYASHGIEWAKKNQISF